jgi:putative transposase
VLILNEDKEINTMKRKQWSDTQKFEIVLAGLRGERPVSEICSEYGVHQTQYYKWRDEFLSHGSKVFSNNKQNHKERVMEKRIQKMQRVIGELTLELKKND